MIDVLDFVIPGKLRSNADRGSHECISRDPRSSASSTLSSGMTRFLIIFLMIFSSLQAMALVIVIDPGHGGKDTGAIGTTFNTLEKDISLLYTKSLYRELKKHPQYRVLMTREHDISLSKEDRHKKIKEMKADLLISIHADSNPDPEICGASVYTISKQAAQEEKLVLSEQKNKKNILKNKELLEQNKEIANMLIDMVHTDTINTAIKVAQSITDSLSKKVHMLPKSHRFAGFKVLKGVDIPAILIEVGYLSNPQEERLLNSAVYRKMFIQTLVEGINKGI